MQNIQVVPHLGQFQVQLTELGSLVTVVFDDQAIARQLAFHIAQIRGDGIGGQHQGVPPLVLQGCGQLGDGGMEAREQGCSRIGSHGKEQGIMESRSWGGAGGGCGLFPWDSPLEPRQPRYVEEINHV